MLHLHHACLGAALLALLSAAAPPASAETMETQPRLAPAAEPSGVASLGAEPARYRVGVGDTLKVDVYGEQDLCGAFEVYDGGWIAYPLVGRLQAQGLTLPQLTEALSAALAQRFLVDPHVSVQVERYASQPVQVLGAVAQPGVFYLEGTTTVRQMLALAGGVVSEKAIKEVRVERETEGQRQVHVLKLERLLADGEGDLVLQSGDVVNVVEGLVVYVSGQVKKSGTVPFWDGLTVTRALAEAGGPDTYAKLRSAYLLRDGQRITFRLRRLLQGRDQDIPMRPGDQLVIEESMF